jgi:hypothetical protein
MTELTDPERRAINEYLGENWGDFQQTAEQYLTPEETEALGEKLEKQ